MATLSARGQKWLKGIHIAFAGVWIGAGVCLVLMQIFLRASSGQMLYGIDISMKFIDDFIIIPGAFGSFLTGLIYALFTKWGFFKHRWIIVKWVINVGGIIFGTFWLGPWVNGMSPISGQIGLDALSHPTYLHNKTMNAWFGPVQVSTLIFAVIISALKPWKPRRTKA